MDYALENGTIVTCDKKFRIIIKSTILVKNGKIHDIFSDDKAIPNS